jgi:hypothetical protein
MLSSNRLSIVILLSVGITAATTAQAGVQLFEASWSVKAFGNEITGGTGEEEFYSAIGIPLGAQCNANQPRCPWESTPTDGSGNWSPLGGIQQQALFCAPWYNWGGLGATHRPYPGSPYYSSSHTGMKFLPTPPLYRNPNFFTSAGQPNITPCTAMSTDGSGGKGVVQAGQPVAGTWIANTTGTQLGGFSFNAAPVQHQAGLRVGQGTRGKQSHSTRGVYYTQGSARSGQIGEFPRSYPYIYSYTYATLRNDQGVFGPGSGPGNFNLLRTTVRWGFTVASINVKQGAAKFGGTMRMLGALTSKGCYFLNGGCSLGENNWRYDAVGASIYTTLGGGITEGYIATYKAYHYHTALMQKSTVLVEGERFPWTTGSVTVRATERGPHKTVHFAQGYDNRNTATPTGTGRFSW